MLEQREPEDEAGDDENRDDEDEDLRGLADVAHFLSPPPNSDPEIGADWVLRKKILRKINELAVGEKANANCVGAMMSW